MDNLPEPQVIIQQHSFPKIPVIISGVIILLAIIFLGLKYFNFPKATTKSTLTQTTAPKVTLSCPVPKEFCSLAKTIPSSSFFLGLGLKLPTNTPLLAPFDGKYQIFWQEDKEASYSATLKVTDSTNKYSAIYLFAVDKPPTVKLRQEYQIKKGVQMAVSSGKSVPYRFQEGNSLVFYVYKGKEDLPESRIPLKPADLLKPVLLDSLVL